MVLTYHSLMESGVVLVFVGKDQKRFLIHTELASSFPVQILQPPIAEEFDEVVFGRCCEFVYTGDYSVPPPIYDGIRNQSATESVRRWDPAGLSWNFFHPGKFPIVCADLRERLGQVNPNYRANDESSTDPKYSYADVFLCHAEIYSFASRTGWTALCHLSLYRLLGLLANFTLCEERTGDIVTLFKFTFENVDSEEFESIGDIKFEGMGDLKKLMGDYAMWNLEILMQDMDFQLVLDKMPSLANAFFRWMWK
ncbi:uncharacterized protein N7477_004114 [Penicillium maclennaniae]|uniref:uncharacterized protein n=1 Tax=Penicillium maclennaniae TaxID=1343394 RepID=UPI002541380D|nr:uncharacterized protein N7477_004114 [Penicillium maclennaniae]KAJ5678481.1 hypothetical protein N7477_004114 [Penicillium maclennaniae]